MGAVIGVDAEPDDDSDDQRGDEPPPLSTPSAAGIRLFSEEHDVARRRLLPWAASVVASPHGEMMATDGRPSQPRGRHLTDDVI